MKRVAINTFIVLTTLALAGLVIVFRRPIVTFVFSLAVAAVVRPLVERLASRFSNRGLAAVLVYAFIFLLIAGVLYGVSLPFFSEMQRLSDSLVTTYDQMWAKWPSGTGFQQAVIARLPPPSDLYQAIAGERGATMMQTFIGFTSTGFAFLSEFIAVFILSIYWTIDRIHFERLWLSLLPAEGRVRAREVWRDIESSVGGYIRSEIIQSLLAGLIFGLGFWLLAMPYPTLLAVIAALAWLIPWLGVLLVLLPVGLVGFSISTALGVNALLFAVVVLIFLETVVEPRLFERGRYSTVLKIIVLVAMADLLGLVGMLLAPPLAAAIQLLFANLLNRPAVVKEPVYKLPVREIAELDQRVQEVDTMLAQLEMEPSPRAASMLGRLKKLVSEANDLITDQGLPSSPRSDNG